MSDLWIYFQIGLKHVLDINAYDHVLFLIALTVPYSFKDWKQVLILVTTFTVGHTLALFMSVFGLVTINSNLVEFLIPISIIATAIFHLFTAGKPKRNESFGVTGFITLFFGIIHGLGFSNFFKSILPGNASDQVAPLLQFALGIEAAQLIVVLLVLIVSYIIQTFFRFSKRDFALVMSAFVIGVVLPMIIESELWNK